MDVEGIPVRHPRRVRVSSPTALLAAGVIAAAVVTGSLAAASSSTRPSHATTAVSTPMTGQAPAARSAVAR